MARQLREWVEGVGGAEEGQKGGRVQWAGWGSEGGGEAVGRRVTGARGNGGGVKAGKRRGRGGLIEVKEEQD